MVPRSLNVKTASVWYVVLEASRPWGQGRDALMLFLIPDVRTPCPQPEKIPQAHLCTVHFPACTFFVV